MLEHLCSVRMPAVGWTIASCAVLWRAVVRGAVLCCVVCLLYVLT